MEPFLRNCIETTGPNIFQCLYILKSCYCVHKTPLLVLVLLDWSLYSTTGHNASSLVRILQHCSLPSTTGTYSPPLVHILYHRSPSSAIGPHPLHWSPSSTPVPILYHWSPSSTPVPILYHWSRSSTTGPYPTPMVPIFQYVKISYSHRLRICNIACCLNSQHRSINISLPEV